MEDLWTYEKEGKEQGFSAIAGVDEAGRGPLAGPVYTAAVILPFGVSIEGLNDSKKLTPKKRDILFDEICKSAVSYSITYRNEKVIDEINILQATMEAMAEAVLNLNLRPDLVLVDGDHKPKLPMKTHTIVKGDSKSASIAAASILAKVSRDRFMQQISPKYPEYNFSKHKGYGTEEHRNAILRYGPCPIHRKSFLKKILAKSK